MRNWTTGFIILIASCWLTVSQAGVMTHDEMVKRFSPPMIVGGKDASISVWPIFKQNATANELVGVQDPRHDDALTAVLQMDGRSVATSGDYETTFTPDFVHNHIFDPTTGDSPLELASVTVAASTGLQADGLSTALFVMGSAKAMPIASQRDNVDVLLLDKQGKTWMTPGLRTSRA